MVVKFVAYNQTGQNYFEQLAAYNSMSSHLRRILLARSVVDARNKNYILDKNKQCKLTDDKGVYSRPEVTDDLIDRLAYDTEHHPMVGLSTNRVLIQLALLNDLKREGAKRIRQLSSWSDNFEYRKFT